MLVDCCEKQSVRQHVCFPFGFVGLLGGAVTGRVFKLSVQFIFNISYKYFKIMELGMKGKEDLMPSPWALLTAAACAVRRQPWWWDRPWCGLGPTQSVSTNGIPYLPPPTSCHVLFRFSVRSSTSPFYLRATRMRSLLGSYTEDLEEHNPSATFSGDLRWRNKPRLPAGAHRGTDISADLWRCPWRLRSRSRSGPCRAPRV